MRETSVNCNASAALPMLERPLHFRLSIRPSQNPGHFGSAIASPLQSSSSLSFANFGWEHPDSAAARFHLSAEFPLPSADVRRVSSFKSWPTELELPRPDTEFEDKNDDQDD
jgi:hypothetical protein